ncbi:LacI family transcriptional regulator [Actinoplanes cyaneus]|uniref:LacI family transcriptional regulator n=1 Tax=Actinoplanes cyaneus TaxID=52696 RepID=A0A919IMT1_9ACTN|nr:LacI family DNA-binding transcriptional regulator [Actinoplanes cyaneus]MCW2139791.1 transcriptional regulator, LacI family [Actinoplanes cyaneus]GID67921.1 LacI family transcriptional regulator [Actinoplanes cyaneus]
MKRPTIAEIAARAGVSISAVSYALNGRPGVSDATRRHILAIADQIGWRPSVAARSLSGSRAHSVGLVIAWPADTLGAEPFFMRFIAGLEGELSRRSIGLLLQFVDDHRAAIDAMRRCWAERRVDGMVLTDLWRTDSRLPVVEELGIPAVLVGGPRADSRLPSVWTDDTAAVTSAVDYLVALGHRRIARVAGLPALEHTQVRIGAFRAAARTHGLPEPQVIETDFTREAGVRATRTLLSRRDRPTAIMYDNDVMAAAALNVAQEMNVAVPDELSVVAGDDSQLCFLVRPALTALARDIQAYGVHTARVMMDVIDGRSPQSQPDTPTRLVVRASTAAPAT